MSNKETRARELSEKLARHAASAKKIGNIQEAMAFAAKVAEIADKYGFEAPDGSHEEDNYVTIPWKNVLYYQKEYACKIAKIYGVAGIMHKSKRGSDNNAYSFLCGKPVNIEMVKTLYEYSEPVLQKAMKAALKEHREKRECYFKTCELLDIRPLNKSLFATDKLFRRDFYIGVAAGIKARIEHARASYSAGLSELISSEYTAALDEYKKKNGVRTKRTSRISKDAYDAGKAASSGVSSGLSLSNTKLIGK